MNQMFRSLSVHNYRLWFIGALVSNIGTWMQATTQNWVVLTDLTDNDAAAVGITMALQFGPQLLLVPISGWAADRFDRRKILICTQTALMALGLTLGLILVLGHASLGLMYLFALLLGIINAFDAPARQTFVSDLVGAHNMSNAVALNSASFNSARLLGPAVAGVLIVLVGAGWVFLINAVTFLAMLWVLTHLRTEELNARPKRRKERGQLVAGMRYVAGRSDLVIVFITVFIMGTFGMNFPIFSSTMAVEFDRGAGEYGLLSSILAVGSLTGALLSARRPRARMRVIIIAAAAFGAAAMLSAAMPTFWTFAASTILLGFTTVTLMTTANGYVQTNINPALRGRVMALYMAITMGGTAIGAPMIGAISNAFGPRMALVAAGIACIIAAAIGLGWMVFRQHLRLTRVEDSSWRLGMTHDGEFVDAAVPEEFSDEIAAATSPIELPERSRRLTD